MFTVHRVMRIFALSKALHSSALQPLQNLGRYRSMHLKYITLFSEILLKRYPCQSLPCGIHKLMWSLLYINMTLLNQHNRSCHFSWLDLVGLDNSFSLMQTYFLLKTYIFEITHCTTWSHGLQLGNRMELTKKSHPDTNFIYIILRTGQIEKYIRSYRTLW